MSYSMSHYKYSHKEIDCEYNIVSYFGFCYVQHKLFWLGLAIVKRNKPHKIRFLIDNWNEYRENDF